MSAAFLDSGLCRTQSDHSDLARVQVHVAEAERGTKQYQVTRDAEDERVFLIWEEFTDEAAVQGEFPIPHLMILEVAAELQRIWTVGRQRVSTVYSRRKEASLM